MQSCCAKAALQTDTAMTSCVGRPRASQNNIASRGAGGAILGGGFFFARSRTPGRDSCGPPGAYSTCRTARFAYSSGRWDPVSQHPPNQKCKTQGAFFSHNPVPWEELSGTYGVHITGSCSVGCLSHMRRRTIPADMSTSGRPKQGNSQKQASQNALLEPDA